MMRARGEVVLAALLAAAALMLSSLDSRSDVRMLEIGNGDVELLPLDGAVGPESLVFSGDGDGEGGPVHRRVGRAGPQVGGRALLLRARPVSFHRRRPVPMITVGSFVPRAMLVSGVSVHHASSLLHQLAHNKTLN